MIDTKNISFDHCIKCTTCTVYCPVAKVSHLFPGPKQSGPDAERLRIKNPELVDSSLKYCTNCKRCEISCPSDVRIADLIQRAKNTYLKKGFRLRTFLLSRMDWLGRLIAPVSFITNFLMSKTIIKILLELFLKISSGISFPEFEKNSFSKWLKNKGPDQSQFDKQVLYFTGCSINWMDHGLGRDLVKVLNNIGIGIRIPDTRCCGVPAIANSDLKKAKKNAFYNISKLKEAIDGKCNEVVLTCSSGTLALKYEYPNLLGIKDLNLFDNIHYITSYLFNKLKDRDIQNLKPVNIRVAYHSPCHLERIGGVIFTIDVLKKIPGLDLVILHSECCGISGTYGFKKEYFEISKSIGSYLFSKIDEANPEFVVTDCVTCKWQIENFTDYKVIHPVTLLAMSL